MESWGRGEEEGVQGDLMKADTISNAFKYNFVPAIMFYVCYAFENLANLFTS